jgi:uncharacterized protein YjeT (DUF2065 family)
MGKKFLVLLDVLEGLNPLVSETFVWAVLIAVSLAFVVVLIVLFSQKANDRMVKLITALSRQPKNRVSSKKN